MVKLITCDTCMFKFKTRRKDVFPFGAVKMSWLAKKEHALDRPVNYSLIDIFKELRFGRVSVSQQYLTKCIEELEKTNL